MSDLLNKASLVVIPSGYKEDTVYSVVPSDGSGDLSFTRASNGTRINSAGLVEVCPWNLIPNSQTFASWAKVQISGSTVTVTDNFVTAPNGTLTGAKVVFSKFDTTAQIYQDYSLSPTQVLNATLYAKVPSGTKQAYFGFFDGLIKTQLKTLTTEWQRIEYTGSVTAGGIRACWFYGDGAASNVEVHLWGGQLNVGSTAKPYFPTTDRLNVPRLTYQNGGGGCPSLLLEPQRTNLNLYSQDLTNIVYSSGGSSGHSVTTTSNYAISPDGTQNATRVQIVRGSSYAELFQRLIATIGTTYTLSFWGKSLSGTPKLYTAWNGGSYENEVTFTSEWTRYSYTYTVSSLASAGFNLITWTSLPSTSTSADILIWGVQFEQSSYPTSYIPTTSASATRVADLSTSDTIQTAQTFAGDFTIFADFVPFIDSTDANGLMILGGGASGLGTTYRSYLWFVGSNVYLSGDGEVNIIQRGYSMVVNQRVKIALTRVGTTVKMFVNGAQVGASATSSLSITIRSIGWSYNLPTYQTQGKINQVVLSATGFSDADCQSLTTI
jgi:hypothetical protein